MLGMVRSGVLALDASQGARRGVSQAWRRDSAPEALLRWSESGMAIKQLSLADDPIEWDTTCAVF